MTIEIKTSKNAKRMLIEISKAPHKHKRALRLALNEIGSEVVNSTANFIFNPPKTGRWYNFNGRPYQASAPGESPANRSGRLAKSGDYKVRNFQEMTVGETAYYAKWLEEGTRDGRIKPRPHIIRAVNKHHRDAVNAIREHVQQELSR